MKNQFASQGVEPAGSVSPAAFDRFFRADFERVAKVIRIAGIKPE